LDRNDDQVAIVEEPPSRSKSRWPAFVAGAVVIIAVTALVTYAFAPSTTKTKTVVKTVAAAKQQPVAPVVNDRGFSKLDNGEQAKGPGFYAPLSPTERLALQHELEIAQTAAMRYPTVKDAEAAGWRRAGPFAPGLGAHYMKWTGTDGSGFVPAVGLVTDDAAAHPLSLIYDGTQPNSRIAGLMYLGQGFRIPEGFAGEDDVWHYHTNVCTVYRPDGSIDTPFGADTTVTKALCNTVPGGQLMKTTPYMLHVWVVPGYESPEGVFSHLNEAITCRDGSYHVINFKDIGTRSSVCVDGGE
jgi:hypothetical protein